MVQSLKELVAVLALTLPVWFFARRLFAPFSSEEIFLKRRNVWIAITVTAFLSPNIWLYLMVAGVIVYRAGQRDPNPAALCVLLYIAIPNATIPIPALLVNDLFSVNHRRILAIALLIPAALRLLRSETKGSERKLDLMDLSLLALGLLTLLLPWPYESITNTARRGLLLILDTWVVYFVVSRIRPDTAALKDCMAAWLLAALLASAVGIFESVRGWLLYVGINYRWGDPNVFAFLLRAGTLRAQASVGHSLGLGLWLATAWAFLLCLHRDWHSKWSTLAVATMLVGGLWAAFSRAAWIAALLSTLVFFILHPDGPAKGIKLSLNMFAGLLILLMSPLGDKIVAYLPFIGTVDSANVEYRQRLFDLSITLIALNPWFGDPFVVQKMESLRQGQGIVDIVNGYVSLALFHGLVGLGLFLILMLAGLTCGFRVSRGARHHDLDMSYAGTALMAAMVGTLFFIATSGVDSLNYVLAAMLSGCWWLHRNPAPRITTPALSSRYGSMGRA